MLKRKIILFFGICSLFFVLNGCVNNNAAEEDVSNNEQVETDTGTEAEPKEIKLGDTVEVSTEYGNFELTIDRVRDGDMYPENKDSASDVKIVLLEAQISNIGFEDPYNEFFILEQYISVTDEDGFVLEASGTGYEDGKYSIHPTVPKGAKARVYVPYIITKEMKAVTIDVAGCYVTTEIVE